LLFPSRKDRLSVSASKTASPRVRALAASGAIAVSLVVLLCLVRFHFDTGRRRDLGARRRQVRAGADGFIKEIAAAPGSSVRQAVR